MKRIPLTQMKVNQKARVIEVAGGRGLQNRLISMGIYSGKEITKLSHFMLRGTIAIKVGTTVLALGHGMASKIIVEAE